MKSSLLFRTSLITLLALLFIFGQVLAQVKPDKQAQKTAQEKAQEAEMQQNKDLILKLINDHSFVIEANTLQDRHLNTYQVNSETNFVKVDGKEAVVQFGFDGVAGWNGVGGLTVDGARIYQGTSRF